MDRFREEEILSRPAFRGVASELRDGGRVVPAALLAATASYLACLDAGNVEVAVMDALLPFIPSLLAWGHDAAALAISGRPTRAPGLAGVAGRALRGRALRRPGGDAASLISGQWRSQSV